MKRTREQFNSPVIDQEPIICLTTTQIDSIAQRPNKVCKAPEEAPSEPELLPPLSQHQESTSFWSDAQMKMKSCLESQYNDL